MKSFVGEQNYLEARIKYDCLRVKRVNSEGSPQNADHADCRLQTVQTLQIVQTVQTEWFFLTLDSLFSVFQLQSSVQYILMFVIYPQAAQTQHSTVDSIDIRVIDFVWKIPFTGPKYTKLEHKNKLPRILGANCVNF